MRKTLIILGILLVVISLTGACGTPESPPVEPTSPTEPTEPTPPAPAEFELQSLDVVPSGVASGETMTVTAVVKNIGGSEGTYTAALTVDGATVEEKEVTIAPSSSETIIFSLTEDTPGTYEIGFGGLSSALVVEEIAAIEVTVDPNPVSCHNGQAYWTLIFTEVNGIGVTIQNLTIYTYQGDNLLSSRSYGVSEMEEWWGSVYLLPYGVLTVTSGSGLCQEVTHEVVVITGEDDKGHVVRGEGRVEISES